MSALGDLLAAYRDGHAAARAFKASGGKAILYQGYLDPAVAARMAIGYHEDVTKTMGGPAATDEFIRLFMVPGMLHCSGGPGTDQFGGSGRNAPIIDAKHDLLSALEAWVERGEAPASIIATKLNDGSSSRTRPLCPYPAVAKYDGSGSTDDASNFSCVRP
jgi:feruloyl esterase